MSYLSMCQDDSCPSAKKCHRHEASPSEYQSYMDFGRPKGAKKCAAFMKVRERKEKRRDYQKEVRLCLPSA